MRSLIIILLLTFNMPVFCVTQEGTRSQDLVLKLIQLSVKDGGINNEQEILEVKQLIEKLPKPKNGDRKKARQLNDKGLEYLKMGQSSLATQSFQESLKVDPADVEVVNNLGYAYLTEGNSDAEQYLLQAIRMAPGRTSAWANLGQFYAKQDKNEFAVACFAHAFRFSQNRIKTIQFLNGLADKDETLKVIIAKTLQLKLIKDFAISAGNVIDSEQGTLSIPPQAMSTVPTPNSPTVVDGLGDRGDNQKNTMAPALSSPAVSESTDIVGDNQSSVQKGSQVAKGKIVIAKYDLFTKQSGNSWDLSVKGSVKNIGKTDVKNVIVGFLCHDCIKKGEKAEMGRWFPVLPSVGQDTISYLAMGDKEDFEFSIGVAVSLYRPSSAPNIEIQVISFEEVE